MRCLSWAWPVNHRSPSQSTPDAFLGQALKGKVLPLALLDEAWQKGIITFDRATAVTNQIKPPVVFYGESLDIAERLAERCSLIHLRRSSTGLQAYDTNSKAALRFVPNAVYAIFYDSEDLDDDSLEMIHKWATYNYITAPIVAYDENVFRLAVAFSETISHHSRSRAGLIYDLAALRQIHEELLNSHDELRSYVHASGGALPKVAFYHPPSSVADPERCFVDIIQPLPIDYRRLTAVSVYNSQHVDIHREGEINVSLFATDDDDLLHEWRVSRRRVPYGWMTFAFERRKGIYLRKNVALRMTVTNLQDPMHVAFGQNRVRSGKAAIIPGKSCSEALALKCWVAPSGARLAISEQMWPVVRLEGHRTTQIELDVEGGVEIVDVLHANERMTHPTVLWDHNRKWILVHPIDHNPTIAEIPNACPVGTKRVIAEVETVNDNACDVEFAMTLVRPGQSEELIAFENLDWFKVPAMTQTEISIDLNEETEQRYSVLLLTRISELDTSEYCWSHFKRIVFEGRFEDV